MRTIERIAKNTATLFIGNLISIVFQFFCIVYTARYLGALNFGVLAFALAFTRIFSVITDLGLQLLIVREVARDRFLARQYLTNISGMKLVMNIVAFGLIALTINLLDYPKQSIQIVYIIALSVVFNSFTQIFYSIFQAYEEMEYQSLGQILNSVLMFFGVLIAINHGFNVIGFGALYFIVSFFILLYCFIVLRVRFSDLAISWLKRKVEVDWVFWKSKIREALPFGLAMVFVSIFYWIDSVMLSLIKGDAAVGYYNVAYRIVLVLIFIPGSYITAIYPVTSKLHITSQKTLLLSYKKSFRLLTLIGVPIGVGITLLAKKIILLMFGTEYLNSVLALQILVWSTVFLFMSYSFANLFNSINQQKLVTKIAGFALILNIALNLILIPKYSIIGASISTVMTEFIRLVFFFIYSAKIGYGFSLRELVGFITKIIFSCIVMGFFIFYFYTLNLIVIILLAILVYFVVILSVKGIYKEDFDLIKMSFSG